MDKRNKVKGLSKVTLRAQGNLEDLRPEPASPTAGRSGELQDYIEGHQDEKRWGQQGGEGGH